jgi:hypothetical protein
VKLSEIEFIGLARLFNVPLVTKNSDDDEKPVPRSFEEILSDMMDKFISLRKAKRKEIFKILRAATSKEKEKGEDE